MLVKGKIIISCTYHFWMSSQRGVISLDARNCKIKYEPVYHIIWKESPNISPLDSENKIYLKIHLEVTAIKVKWNISVKQLFLCADWNWDKFANGRQIKCTLPQNILCLNSVVLLHCSM